MKSRSARFIALFAGVHLLGGHWLALQTVAWIGMFAANSHEVSLTEALGKTFDGKRPCALCVVVEAGQKEEKDQQDRQLLDSVGKVNAVILPLSIVPAPVAGELVYFEGAATAVALRVQPPSPPPWGVSLI